MVMQTIYNRTMEAGPDYTVKAQVNNLENGFVYQVILQRYRNRIAIPDWESVQWIFNREEALELAVKHALGTI